MSDLDAWVSRQLDQCAYDGNPGRIDLVHRLVRGFRSLHVLAMHESRPRGLQLFGLVVPETGLQDAPALAARARSLLEAWVAAMDVETRTELALGLAPDLRAALGLARTPRPVGVLEVDLAVEVEDRETDRRVRDADALERFDGASTTDVGIEALPFAADFPELVSFSPRLAFDPSTGLVLRARFELASRPDAARGATLIEAIACGVREARAWLQAEWEPPFVHTHRIEILTNVLDARLRDPSVVDPG